MVSGGHAGALCVKVSVKMDLNTMELKSQMDISKADEREALEHLTETFVQNKITQLFSQIQTEKHTDIFGLGRLLYERDPVLRNEVEETWDTMFQSADIQVQVAANIKSAGVLKVY